LVSNERGSGGAQPGGICACVVLREPTGLAPRPQTLPVLSSSSQRISDSVLLLDLR
jgi:hypothetical protein